jgi:hypothetical protein
VTLRTRSRIGDDALGLLVSAVDDPVSLTMRVSDCLVCGLLRKLQDVGRLPGLEQGHVCSINLDFPL